MPHIRQLNFTCDLLALHRVNTQRYPFLLKSVASATSSSRFDILFSFPEDEIRLEHDNLGKAPDFLRELDRQWLKNQDLVQNESSLPFSGGWFLYLGYELSAQVEPVLSLPSINDGLPVAYAVRIPAAIIHDNIEGKTVVVTETDRIDLADYVLSDIEKINNKCEEVVPGSVKLEEEDPQRYIAGVNKIKQYITEGDVFQVNLSRQWSGRLAEEQGSDKIYQNLCHQNPAPFSGLALIDGVSIISSSPERLARIEDGWIETRPIAGTRPRGEDGEKDRSLQDELLAHPKEQAEHIMLIDLERNDLGRVCVPGTIEVNEMMALESYSHVHHIVSNVRGKLQDKVTPGEAIRAIFPGGTITGCPKVRCMEIIAELEEVGRGAYTGSMGYLNHDGSMDLNILIRTIVQNGKEITLRAGAGIVFDSIPEKELEETRAKARGLILALSDEMQD